MKHPKQRLLPSSLIAVAILTLWGAVAPALAADKPNILFIMGDDIGIYNVGVYHRGLMVGETPTSTASRAKVRRS